MALNSNPSLNLLNTLPDLRQIPPNLEKAAFLQAMWGKTILKNFIPISFSLSSFRWIVAVDVAYPPDPTPEWGVACAVLWDYTKHEIVQWTTYQGPTPFPYTPGFLGFREASIMEQAIRDLNHPIDLILTDGHGLVHPRGFGQATHVGALLRIPSIGVGKSPFFGSSAWRQLPRLRGSFTSIWKPELSASFDVPPDYFVSLPQLLGYALCLTSNCNPIFVSSGFQMCINSVIPLILSLSGNHRLPEPLFYADFYARRTLAKIQKEKTRI